ncbi:hypothetical protein FRC12_022562 [Ceratobasidium sp. 428]|nr:hypothetical protein FRC12_022562 [Ceratobasidium sp. 428]
MLAVSGSDGVYVRVFEVRPRGRYSKGGPRLTEHGVLTEGRDTGILWHWYDLQRGVTRRRVTNIVWSADSKWISVVTVRGTIHIFPINPYGGPSTGASHLLGSGRVVNMSEPQRAPVSLSSVLRFHSSGTVTPTTGAKPSSGVPVSTSFGRPSKPSRDSGAQDVYVFNHKTGELVLRQCVVRMQPASTIERGMQGVQASMSLPSALSSSGLSTLSGNSMSALSNMMRGTNTTNVSGASADSEAGAMILGGAEGAARTWGAMMREVEWGEVRATLEKMDKPVKEGKPEAKAGRSDWLAQAEITTCTRSTKLLSGPIYLSHQFAFLSLCEDWQALLQQSHLNLPATKIVVRREVSARAIPDTGSDGAFLGSGNDESFATSTSLDAPLASALGGSISPESASQQIPSYPNAYSGGRGTSWKDPVKRLSHISDGIGQGLGTFRREIGRVERRVRSPTSPTTPVVPGITLEFDENDALFEVDEDMPPREAETDVAAGLGVSREDDGSRSAESNTSSVPSTVPDMAPLATPDIGDWGGDDASNAEEAEYSHAREEDSRFDDLVGEWRVAGAGWNRSVDHGAGSDMDDTVGVYDGDDGAVGFMDEEEEDRRLALEAAAVAPVSKKKHRKKR